jgi:hypothetical protein
MKRKKRYADGGEVMDEMTVTGQRPQNVGFDMNRMMGTTGGQMGPPSSMSGGMGPPPPPSPLPMGSTAAQRPRPPIGRTAGYLGPTMRGEDGSRVSAGVGPRGSFGVGASMPFKKGGAVKKMAKGGSTASKRGDGIASKGKTKGRMV